eukprot:1141242-Pelagomonas_calceolata.AAC.5
MLNSQNLDLEEKITNHVKGYKGGGLQPETLAERLLFWQKLWKPIRVLIWERVDLRTSSNLKACQERNKGCVRNFLEADEGHTS